MRYLKESVYRQEHWDDGKKSESFIDTENPQLPLFETLQGEDESPDDPEDRELITYTRKKTIN